MMPGCPYEQYRHGYRYRGSTNRHFADMCRFSKPPTRYLHASPEILNFVPDIMSTQHVGLTLYIFYADKDPCQPTQLVYKLTWLARVLLLFILICQLLLLLLHAIGGFSSPLLLICCYLLFLIQCWQYLGDPQSDSTSPTHGCSFISTFSPY